MSNTNVEKMYGLTPMQQGMLYHKLLNKGSSEYVLQFVSKFKGALNIDIMEQSLALLATRHETLRTAFTSTKLGQSWQAVLRSRKIELNIEDAINVTDIETYKQSDLLRGFDLAYCA